MKYTQGIVLCPGDREQKGGERNKYESWDD